MTAVLPARIMEFESGTLLRAGEPKEETDEETQSCTTQASSSAWGEYEGSRPAKRRSSNDVSFTPQTTDTQEGDFPLQKKIKSEPKDDYALAEEECARNASQISGYPLGIDYAEHEESWVQRSNSASPVFERIPSFAADECHKFTDNCKRCIINESQSPDFDNVSLHRRRQIREFEQSGEEPLSNKIRVWKEKRLEKSLLRGRAALRLDEEALFLEFKKRKDQMEDEGLRLHHMTTRSRQLSSETGEESGTDDPDSNFGYLRYLLTRDKNSSSPVSGTDENMVAVPQEIPVVQGENQQETTVTAVSTTNDVAEETTQDDREEEGVPKKEETATEGKIPKSSRKRLRQNLPPNFVPRREMNLGRQELLGLATKNKGSRNRLKTLENRPENDDQYHSTMNGGEFDERNGVLQGESLAADNENIQRPEQYISDIQRPYCNIPDDHQVTHINGVMSLPATRETRYGITLGELKRRTGFPEFLTRVDLIAYVRQSKSAGRALLDKFNIATAGQKSHPTILSKMCENEARVLGDGISKMNTEYFPWKMLAKVASAKVAEGRMCDGKVAQKIKAIQSTRSMLKEIYDLVVENKEIPTMKTFEVASHTFGTANILNHLTVFDRLFEEYQSNLILRQDVRNNNRKLGNQ